MCKQSRAGVPHVSFDNPLAKDSDIRHESIEFRVLVLWWQRMVDSAGGAPLEVRSAQVCSVREGRLPGRAMPVALQGEEAGPPSG